MWYSIGAMTLLFAGKARKFFLGFLFNSPPAFCDEQLGQRIIQTMRVQFIFKRMLYLMVWINQRLVFYKEVEENLKEEEEREQGMWLNISLLKVILCRQSNTLKLGSYWNFFSTASFQTLLLLYCDEELGQRIT